MVTNIWQQLTLSRFSPHQWGQGSYLHRLVGLMAPFTPASVLWPWGEPVATLLVALVFLSAPFTSTTMVGAFMALCGAWWLLLTLGDRSGWGLTPIHLLLFLYWIISAIATGVSPVRGAAVAGLFKLTVNLFLFLLAARVLRSRPWLNRLLTLIMLVGLLVSCYGIKQQWDGVEQLATWNDPSSDLAQATRVYSFLGNPNLLAAYLLPMLALSIAAVFIWRGWLCQLLAVLMVVSHLACLFFTQSRGGWLGAVAVLVTFVALSYIWWQPYLSPFWQTWLLPTAIAVLTVVVLVALVGIAPLRLRIVSIFAGRSDSSNNFRINVWEGVKSMIWDRPLLGIGPGNSAFNKIYPLYMRPKYTALSAYSIYLEILVETGILGFTTMIWLMTVTFSEGLALLRSFRNQLDRQGLWVLAAIAAMVGLMVHGFVDTVWYRPPISSLWWLMMALIASQWANYLTKKEQSPENELTLYSSSPN